MLTQLAIVVADTADSDEPVTFGFLFQVLVVILLVAAVIWLIRHLR